MIEENNNKNQKTKIYIFLIFVGLVNNTGFILIISSASRLAESFNKDNLLTLFQSSLVLFSCLIRFINSKYLINYLHTNRCLWALLFFMTGLTIVSISSNFGEYGFYTALLGSVIIGTGSSLGDSTILGFLKAFDSEYIGAYSTGTGFAGVFASGLAFLFLEIFKLNIFNLAFIAILFYIPYYFIFRYIVKLKENISDKNQIVQEAKINKNFTLNNIKDIYLKVNYYSTNLGLVYFLEYSVLGLIGFWHRKPSSRGYFTFLSLIYQTGILLGRSTLKLFEIKKLYYITMFQYIFFSFWVLVAYFDFLNLTFKIIFAFTVGIIGGLSFINVNYSILKFDDILKNEKELGFFLVSISCDLGIINSTIFNILFSYLFN